MRMVMSMNTISIAFLAEEDLVSDELDAEEDLLSD